MMATLDEKLRETLADPEAFQGATVDAMHYDREGGILNLYLSFPRSESIALQFYTQSNWRNPRWDGGKPQEIKVPLEVTEDEPLGAGRDIFGRPSPTTHPEFWRE